MKVSFKVWLFILLSLSLFQIGAARHPQYDEEAREEERLEKQAAKANKSDSSHRNPIRGIASGVKEAAVDSPGAFLADTAQGTAEDAPVVGTIDGAREGSAPAVDKAVKGAFKIATLGYGDAKKVDVEQPEKGSDDVTKFRINL